MLVPLLLLLAPDDAATVLNRCNDFLKSASTLSVHVEVTSKSMPGKGVGTLTFRRPSSLRFGMDWGSERYLYVTSAKSGVEMELSTRLYSEFERAGGFTRPPADVSQVGGVGFPSILVAGDVRRFLPRSAPMELKTDESFGGAKADHIHVSVQSREGTIQADLWVRPNGAPAGYRVESHSMSGTMQYAQTFSRCVANKPVPASTFGAKIPRGFVPYTLSQEPWPIQPDRKMPLAGWVDLKTRMAAGLDNNPPRRRLFVLVAPDCEPSIRAMPTIRDLAAAVPVVILSTARNPKQWIASGLRVCFDPTGASLAELNSPGTPFFILTNDKGIVLRVWYGFDPAEAQAFRKEVLAATAATGGS